MDSRLRHAVAVSRHGSFSRAAEMVGVTQSAVTKSVADLERRLGYALFHRTPKGVLPTAQGQEFINRAARLVSDFGDLLRNRDTTADPFSGILRVGIYPGSLEWMLTCGLAALVRQKPSVRLEMNTGSSEQGLHLLQRGDIDLAFGIGAAFENKSGLQFVAVGHLRTRCFVRREHPLLTLDSISLDDIARYNFVSPSLSAPYAAVAREIYESRGLDPTEMLHIADFFPLVRRIVAESDAIGVIADATIETTGFKEEFETLRGPDIFPPVTVGCATRSEWSVKSAARLLTSTLLALKPGMRTGPA